MPIATEPIIGYKFFSPRSEDSIYCKDLKMGYVQDCGPKGDIRECGEVLYTSPVSAMNNACRNGQSVVYMMRGSGRYYDGLVACTLVQRVECVSVAPADVLLHHFALWCARRYLLQLKGKAAIRKYEEFLKEKEFAIASECFCTDLYSSWEKDKLPYPNKIAYACDGGFGLPTAKNTYRALDDTLTCRYDAPESRRRWPFMTAANIELTRLLAGAAWCPPVACPAVSESR